MRSELIDRLTSTEFLVARETVIKALISADKANISLEFKQATAIDLAGRDVFQAVQISVNPKVITTPKVAAVAADGIQ